MILDARSGFPAQRSPTRFTRLIGEPPMRYLARWRIQVAAHQLRKSDTLLARIAEQVGYESEAAFNRAFKRAFADEGYWTVSSMLVRRSPRALAATVPPVAYRGLRRFRGEAQFTTDKCRCFTRIRHTDRVQQETR